MRLMIFVAIGLVLTLLVGCGTGMIFSGAKAGMKVIEGAEADVIPLNDISPSTLKAYGTIQVGEVTTDVGRICPPTCVAAVRLAAKEVFTKELKEVFPGGGKKLIVNIVCRFFKEKPLIGKEARLDLLVTLVDGDSRQELGKLFIEGISESARARKAEDLAKENAEELAKFLEKRKGKD